MREGEQHQGAMLSQESSREKVCADQAYASTGLGAGPVVFTPGILAYSRHPRSNLSSLQPFHLHLCSQARLDQDDLLGS